MDANKMETVIGPVIGDREFYLLLDTEKYPALADCVTMLDSGDAEGAAAVFARVARGVLLREKYFSLHSRCLKPELTKSVKATAERAIVHQNTAII